MRIHALLSTTLAALALALAAAPAAYADDNAGAKVDDGFDLKIAKGEVTVTARVSQGGSSSTVATNFNVAFQVPAAQAEFPDNPGSALDVQHYLSAPTLTPSSVRVTTPARPGATPGISSERGPDYRPAAAAGARAYPHRSV